PPTPGPEVARDDASSRDLPALRESACTSTLRWHGVGRPRIATMHLLCAWCRREGKPGYLGMREPLENPAPTHGVCGIHKERLLESFPSRSFPDAELLIVVRRNGTLYERLRGSFAGVRRVKVIVARWGALGPDFPFPVGPRRTRLGMTLGMSSQDPETRDDVLRGIVRPSAFAVLRLMTSSNLVGCSTGRSAGLAPFRT